MANRSNTFLLKRSNVVDKIPVLSGLTLGEVALNTADAKLYTLYTNGSVSPTEVREIGWNRLSISGGTLYGGLTINGNLSTTSISPVDYIDFNTGSTITNKSGRLFYDNTSESLSYNSSVNPNVIIKVGQQLYTRVVNNTGSLISKGSAVTIQTTSNNIPEISLAIASVPGIGNQVAGLVSEDIPNGSRGLILNQGLLSGVTVSHPVGSILYLSDTVPGGTISSTSSLSYNSRTNQIGYTVASGTTNGIIYVSINNEDINLSLTDIERNILEGNVISTGTFSYTGLTKISSTQFSVSPVQGWVVNNTYEYATNPTVVLVSYSGVTSATTPYLSSSDQTYVLVSSASTLVLQTTFPTPEERRQNIFLGKLLHPSRTEIQNVNNTVDFDVSPMSALRDLWTPLKLINQGVVISANGSNLSINSSAGALWGNGIGWVTNQLDPNQVVIAGQSPVTFQYRTQLGPITGGTAPYTGNTTLIDPNNYDLNGVVTTVGGGSNSSTNQRVYLFPTGLIRIQYGQEVYPSLAAAVAGAQTEQFTEYSLNRDSGILVGIISVQKSVTTLNSLTNAVFNFVSKFGEVLGGTGGLSTTTLQQAYDNSSNPEIITNSTQDGVQFRGGTGIDTDKNIIIENNSGTQTAWITASGYGTFTSLSATTYLGLPIDPDNYVTGGTYSSGTLTLNRQNGSVTVTGFTDYFVTGGTLSNNTLTLNRQNGSVVITGVTDTFVTGFTYSNNNLSILQNQGQSPLLVNISVMTGLTINGNLTVTGNTSLRSTSVTTLTGTSALFSGTGQNILTVIGSGSSTSSPIFSIQGSSGELFSVTDSLVGSLFSVNDISGLPILEVFSDNTILMGSYLAPSLNTTVRTTSNTGTTTIYSIPTSAYTGAFFEYTVNDGTNLRAGNIMSIWSGSTINYTETSTTDIGNTSPITFNMTVSGSFALLRTSATTNSWTVKTIVRSI